MKDYLFSPFGILIIEIVFIVAAAAAGLYVIGGDLIWLI